jgi:hypothetical protein
VPIITFGMEAKKTSLNGFGNIYRAPIERRAPALHKNVKVRTSAPSPGVPLAPGIYVYWFEVQDGEGEFTVKAFRDGAAHAFAEMPFDTAKNRWHGLQFTFAVTP